MLGIYLGKANGFESRYCFSIVFGQFSGESRWAGEADTYGQHDLVCLCFFIVQGLNIQIPTLVAGRWVPIIMTARRVR